MTTTLQRQNMSFLSINKEPGKFAFPIEHVFSKNEHVGTTYSWNNGSKVTLWVGGIQPEGELSTKRHADQRVGWRKLFMQVT